MKTFDLKTRLEQEEYVKEYILLEVGHKKINFNRILPYICMISNMFLDDFITEMYLYRTLGTLIRHIEHGKFS